MSTVAVHRRPSGLPSGPGSSREEKIVSERDRVETVAIVGAGIGGIYLAAKLGLAGCKLRLHDIDDARLADVRAFGGLDIEGERGGFAAVERATNDLRSAVDGADMIILVTGGNAQAAAARSLARLLQDGQGILLVQGNTGGSLLVRRALDEAGCLADVAIAEMDNYPYSCRRLAPTRIRPIVAKRWLQIAAFPGNRITLLHFRVIALHRCTNVSPRCSRMPWRRRTLSTPDSPTPTPCCMW